MLSSFWRRKNGRLVERLNAAIEASERLNEVYNAPKAPRVPIDRSYVERRHRMPTIAVHDDAGDYEFPSHSEIDLAGDTINHPHAPPDVFTHDVGGLVPRFTDGDYVPTDGAGEHDRGDGTVRNTAVPTEHTDDISLFKEAIEQLELAEQRESEALRELENALRRTEELEAAIALEQKARREAEQGRTDAEQLHADALRAVATADLELRRLRAAPTNASAVTPQPNETGARAKLEAKLMLELASRKEAETQRDKARNALEEARAEIVALREAVQQGQPDTASDADITLARQHEEENVALRARISELEAVLESSHAAQNKADAELTAARHASELTSNEVATLREAADKAASTAAEAHARAMQAAARAEAAEQQASALADKIPTLESERDDSRQTAAKAVRETKDAQEQIAALRYAAEHLAEERAKQEAETYERLETARREVEELRTEIGKLRQQLDAITSERDATSATTDELRATLEKERAEARTAVREAQEEIQALRLAAQEIAANAIERDNAAIERPTLEEVAVLREQIAGLEATLKTEREKAQTAATKATEEIAALRDAAQNNIDSTKKDSELAELRQRLDALDNELAIAEAARYSAEFERDEARKQAADAASRLAALKITQVSHHSSTPVFGAAEPPPIKSSTAAATFDAALADDDVAADEDELDQEFAEAAEARVAHDAGEFLESDRHDAPPSHSEDQEDTIASGGLPKSKTSHADRRSASQAPIPHAPTGTDLAVYETSQPDNSHIVTNDPQETAERRGREKRVPSRMPVTLWREEWGQPLSCFLVDKSSRGAKIEMKPDRIFGGTNRISVGERLTLTFYYAQERTSVFCDVMWMNGNFLGVKYYGQFHTEIVKPRKPGKA